MFVKQEYYISAVNNRATKITREEFEKHKQRWKIFRSLLEGKRIQAVKLEEDENLK